jgi:uncharacterized lipoprotein YmbA
MRRSIRFSQATEKTTDCHSEERKRRRISPHPLEIPLGSCAERRGEILRFAQDDRKKLSPAFLPVLLILLSLAACPSFSPTPDRTRYFALTSQAETDGTAKNPALDEIWLGVGPIRIPGYLDREELVVRVAQNRFDVAQNDRWIEPLEESLSRVLAQNLYALLGSERIVRYPWPNNRRITHQVEVEIFRFEPTADGEAQLSARWAVLDTAGKQVLTGKSSFFKRPIKGQSREAAVDAMSELLADLSREVADAVRNIAQQRK